ncbi:WG repeat-containing protein [Paenibacillus hamazuiensis]|uniref:WG repeat-containing protein n=1 Tax=Paenibacillus hamazuiensis TaxID=2936508 RepID=UPI00201004EC|nr:WG repeat-containing protein [Paenibacillus hamazuiensis]
MRKIVIVCFCLSLFFMTGFASNVLAQDSLRFIIKPLEVDYAGDFKEGMAMIKKNNKWGFIDIRGKIIIEPLYDRVRDFKGGIAIVQKDGKYGILDKKGNLIADIQYDEIEGYSEGLALFKKNGKLGFLDEHGHEVIHTELSYNLSSFSEGLAAFKTNSETGYMDKSGEVVLTLSNSFFVHSFKDGVAQISDGRKIGLIDTSGNVIIEPQYDLMTAFDDNGLSQSVKDGTLRFIDKTGQEMISTFPYTGSYGFSEGMAPVHKNGVWGFIDLAGEEVIPLQYKHAFKFRNGVAQVKKKGENGEVWGVVDKNGKEIIPPQFYNIRPEYFNNFSEGLEPVEMRTQTGGATTSKWGYIDRTGKLIIQTEKPMEYGYILDAYGFSEGLARVQMNHGWGYIANPLETPADWAKTEVSDAISLNLIPDDIRYGYNQSINRADFCKLVIHLLAVKKAKSIDDILNENGKKLNKPVFNDTDDIAILAANALGIVEGKDDNAFDPDGSISRQEAAVMLEKAFKIIGTATPKTVISFADKEDIAPWAIHAVDWVTSIEDMTNRSKVMGNSDENNFNPNGSFTKQQAFITVKRLYNAIK